MGGEVAFWSELTPYWELDNTAWPRTTAFAMRMWNVNESVRFLQRLLVGSEPVSS